MSRLPRLSEEFEESDDEYSMTSRPKAPNFSRPKPQSVHSHTRLKHDRSDVGNVHSISAFHEPNRDMPDEPRFSLDSERTATTSSENSAGSEFAWDGELGELRSKRQPKKFDQQRYTKGPPGGRPTTSTTSSSAGTATASEYSQLMGAPSSASSSKTRIMKRVSVDQQSERLSTSTAPGQWEDTASHHTTSESGDSGSFDMDGRWQSSDYDTSELTDAEIRKLQKKGINPALYAEMKAAKRGQKKWVGSLLGNGFIG